MNNEIKTISPFKNFCMTIGALPSSYLESMSYYETLCWLCKYLEKTINPAINQNAEALKELQDYVANYFDNLDVTEEINNKLDEMAQDGTLAEIINVEMIGSLSNLETTDKTDLVSAINENVETIGGLNNLETTDKTNIVNAVNEVNTNLKNINLSDYTTYTTFTTDYGTISSSEITVAKNNDGSLCKVYGDFELTNLTPNTFTTITLNADTGLNPDTVFTVTGTSLIQDADKTIRLSGIVFNPNGKLQFIFTPRSTSCNIFCLANIIYVKDFGDIVE